MAAAPVEDIRVAATGATTICFASTNSTGFFALDDVSVVTAAATS